jgi:2-phosphoglycerate kinase
MKSSIQKPIVLIGGVSGTGKTTLSNALLNKLNFDHKIGLGWIRETLCTILSEKDAPELFDYSFKTSNINDLKQYFIFKQSEYHKPAIEACIKRAYREGTSLIIEGVNLIPGYFDTEYVSNYFWLKMPKKIEIHKSLLISSTHLNRDIRHDDLIAIRKVGQNIENICKEKNIDLIEFEGQELRINNIISKIEMR